MSALGQKQTCAAQKPMSALPSIADICSAQAHVRFVPKADIALLVRFLPIRRKARCRPPRVDDAFELKFANRFDAYCIFNRHQDPRTNKDLPRLGFVTKPRRNIGYRSDGGVIETSFKANGAERRNFVRDTDAKAKLMSQPPPFLSQRSYRRPICCRNRPKQRQPSSSLVCCCGHPSLNAHNGLGIIRPRDWSSSCSDCCNTCSRL